MKIQFIFSLVSVALATPIPANVDFKPSATSDLVVPSTSSLLKTFSTLIPTFTPTPRQLTKTEIHFNNKEELASRSLQAKSSAVHYVSNATPVSDLEVAEYSLK